MNYNCAKLSANISTNVDTTNIYQSPAIFSQIFYHFTQKMASFGNIQLVVIANILS